MLTAQMLMELLIKILLLGYVQFNVKYFKDV